MHASALSCLLLSLAVCVSAASLQPLLARRVPSISTASIGQGSERRQVSVGTQSSVPSQCTSTCDPVNSEVSLGCPVTACCTIAFETEYYNCLECVGKALNASSYATAQNDLNLLYLTCVDIGFVLPQLELPGQTASNATSTGSVAPPFPTGSSSVTSSGSGKSTGAAISVRWYGIQAETLVGAALLLGFVGLW